MPEQRPQALRDVIARVVAGVIAARHAVEMETKGARRVAARRARQSRPSEVPSVHAPLSHGGTP